MRWSRNKRGIYLPGGVPSNEELTKAPSAGVGVTATLLIHDNFTDSDGTKLDAHTPDILGTGYTKVFGAASPVDEIEDNIFQDNLAGAGITLYHADDVPTSADLRIEADIQKGSLTIPGGNNKNIVFDFAMRQSAGYDQGYTVRIKGGNGSGGQVEIFRHPTPVAFTSMGTANFAWGDTNSMHSIKIELVGDDFTVWFDDVIVHTDSDSNHQSAGKVGLAMNAASSSASLHALCDFWIVSELS